MLDAYQAIGTYPLDVRELGVDVLAAGVLKYLLGSAGLGFMWTRPGLAEELLPTQTGWFADRDIFEMGITRYSPSPTARRFQSGTPPVPNIYAGIAGHGADGGDRDRRDARARERAQRAPDRRRRRARRHGRHAARRRSSRGALVCIRSTDAPELVAALAGEGIVTSERDGNLRVSAHAYNTAEDIDRVLAALARAPRAARRC